AVLVVERLQALCFADVQPAVLAFPGVERSFADAALPGKVGDLLPGFVLFQDCDDLRFVESALLHDLLLRRCYPPTLENLNYDWWGLSMARHPSPAYCFFHW